MPPRLPPPIRQRMFSTATGACAAIPSGFHSYNAAAPQIVTSVPKLGRIARWYLPTMAAIAVGMLFIPESLFEEPTRRTVTLDAANRKINYAITNALDHHNSQANKQLEFTQEERNRMLLDAYGERSSLEDMERALAGHNMNMRMGTGPHHRRRVLEDAYGERTNLRDLERAMEIYEVQ